LCGFSIFKSLCFIIIAMDRFDNLLFDVLRRYGLSNYCLKDKQRECIRHIFMNKKDVLAVLPTGYGKTLIYSLLPALYDASTVACDQQHHMILVISPLISLMHNQVARLLSDGISAVHLCPAIDKQMLGRYGYIH
jgi:superfamily II DNA helicase RecQ